MGHTTLSPGRQKMRVQIVYDSIAEEGFEADWGFSCVVGETLLFDTGRSLHILRHNVRRMGIETDLISHLVLSHNHRDHTGGLGILEDLGEVDVYVPQSFSEPMKRNLSAFDNARVIEITGPRHITENVWSTGELGAEMKEQSLVVKTDNGVSLITGCAHPGLENMIDVAQEFGRLFGVIGGFHDFDRLIALETTSLIGPCHCTNKKEEILDLYNYTAEECSVGKAFEI